MWSHDRRATDRMTARPPFVDAHMHLWDRGRLRYPWLDVPEHAAIGADYGIGDYRLELAAWNLVGAVHVEAGAHADDAGAETAWIGGLSDGTGWPNVHIAHLALDDPDLDRRLERIGADGRIRGVRQIVNWCQDPARCAYAHDLTCDLAWRRGYARLADHGLSFDFHGFPPQLAGLFDVAKANPDVPLIVNHLGLPKPADGLALWRAGIARLAKLPHVSIKLSGVGFVAEPFEPAAFAPLVLEVIDAFGPERVMVASNVPTDRLFATLDRTLGAYEALLAAYSDEARRDLWGRNANRIYRLGLTL